MAEEIGVAYLSVKPKMDGGFDSELQAAGDKGGKGFGTAFSVAAGNLIANAVTKLASIAADTFKEAFENYANYEQLKGGVEKIFDQADISSIMDDANKAYKELNMSANQYLESINQTGASFAATMGDQKGYDTARQGMKAIADYASGTGRSVSELNEKFAMITRATSSYQSIADQFSGILPATSADFLAQAQAAGFLSTEYQKLTDVPVAEYQEAVTAMLEKGTAEMGLAGNTAMESTETISGSIAMLKSSWSNFTTGLLDSNADIGMLGEQLLESLGATMKNVVPVIGTLATRIVTELPKMLHDAFMQIPSMLAPVITNVFGEQMGGQINGAIGGAFEKINELGAQLGAAIVPLLESLQNLLRPIAELLISVASTVLPLVMEAVQIVVDTLTAYVIPTVNDVLNTVTPVVEQISADIQTKMPMVQATIQQVMGVIKGVIDTVWPHVQSIIQTASTVISNVVQKVWPVVSKIIDNSVRQIQAVIQVVWPIVQGIIQTVCSVVEGIISTTWPTIEGIVTGAVNAIEGAIDGMQYLVGVVQGIFDGIHQAITNPVETAKGIIEGAIENIKNLFNFQIQWPHVPLPHFSVSGSANPLDWIEQGPPSFAIEWYGAGGMLDGATLIGAGERGTEFIWPGYDPYLTRYADAIASRMDSGSRTDALLEAILSKSGTVQIDGRSIGRVLAPIVDSEFAGAARRAQYA